MSKLRVAVDVGGTFTDICIMDEETSEIRIEKTSSTPQNPMIAVMDGMKKAKVDLNNVEMFTHGTTVATNALITKRLPRTIMICTEGFRDVIEIRRANKEDLWDTYKDVAKPYIKRRDRLVVKERIDANGKVLVALDETEARKIAEIIKKRDAKAVAICFINSYMNGSHEERMKDILLEIIPDIAVSLSSQVMPEIFEHERFSTTVANAALSPVVVEYTQQLYENLRTGGYQRDLLLLHSGGGVMTAASVKDFAARLAGSGIAAGAIASRFIARLCGYENSIGFDMGGTSTDISLVYEGNSRITKDWYVEYGYPIRFPSIEVLTIGAGGGSLAYTDADGSLKNGPQSAGAFPGPACYGNDGQEPTNTDANLVLGRLGEDLAGGEISLKKGLAEKAIEGKIAGKFNFELKEAAEAIISVANSNMSNAVRLISIARGYDPRDFALVAFGGAGALHGAAIAKELSIPVVIIPLNPGVTSALGCLLVDVQHDFSDSFMASAKDTKAGDLEKAFKSLEDEASKRLLSEGISSENIVIERFSEMMYQGQYRSLLVRAPSNISNVDELIDNFHNEHQREYNFKREDAPVSLFRVAIKATGIVSKAELKQHDYKAYEPKSDKTREIFFEGNSHNASIYQREALSAGANFSGPAIIDQLDSTTFVPPGMSAEIDKYLNIIIKSEE